MGERGPEPGHAYGAAAVTQAIKGVHFPCSKDELIGTYGNKQIELRKGNPMKLKDVLEDIPNDTFNSPVDLEKAIKDNI